jgi:hypothetical protein
MSTREELDQGSLLNELQTNLFNDPALNKTFKDLENDVDESRYLAMIADYIHLMGKVGVKRTEFSPVAFFAYTDYLSERDRETMLRKLYTIMACSSIITTAEDLPPSLTFAYITMSDQLGSTFQDLGKEFHDAMVVKDELLSDEKRDGLFKRLNLIMDQVLYCIVAIFSHESRNVPANLGISANLLAKLQQLGIQRVGPVDSKIQFNYLLRNAAKEEETIANHEVQNKYVKQIKGQFETRLFTRANDSFYETEHPMELLVQIVARKRRKDRIDDPESPFTAESETIEETIAAVLRDFDSLDEWFQVAIHSFDFTPTSNPINAVYWLWIVATTFNVSEPSKLPLYQYLLRYKYGVRGIAARLTNNAQNDPKYQFKANLGYIQSAYSSVTNSTIQTLTPLWWQQNALIITTVGLATRSKIITAGALILSLLEQWGLTEWDAFGFGAVFETLGGIGKIIESHIFLYTGAIIARKAAGVALTFVPGVGPIIGPLIQFIPVEAVYKGFMLFSTAALFQQAYNFVAYNETINVTQHYFQTFENVKTFANATMNAGGYFADMGNWAYDNILHATWVMTKWFAKDVVWPAIQWAATTWLAKIVYLVIILYGLYRIGRSKRVQDMLRSRNREEVESLVDNAQQLVKIDYAGEIETLQKAMIRLTEQIDQVEREILELQHQIQQRLSTTTTVKLEK